MKTKLFGWLRTSWRILTEVPGWPDAPVSMRLRRAIPVVLPCTAMVLLLDWTVLYHAPRVHEQQAALQPLLAVESEIATLKLACPEQQVKELADRAAVASQLLLDSPAELPEFLRTLKRDAADRGWDANFVPSDPTASAPAAGAVIGYLPVRAKLVPLPGNLDVFNSYLGLMERFSATGRRIDLIRLAVRADEHRWRLVEINFRLAYPLPR